MRFPDKWLGDVVWIWLSLLSCSQLLAQPTLPPLPVDPLPRELPLTVIPRGLAAQRLIPEQNQLTIARVALGRRLFFDGRLSKDETVSCATCHRPEHGFASPDALAVGIDGRVGTRNAPTLLNRAYGASFFWDGRAASLEQQALRPIENPLEMDTRVETVLKRLKDAPDYRRQFAVAYEEGICAESLAKALASFQRVLLSGNSAVDRFHSGEFGALTDQQRQGLWIFESRGRCWKCHSGRNLTDERFHNTGVSWGSEPIDLGRFSVTGKDEDRGRFRTPTLRSVAETAPYMHDGSLTTLRQVVDFYDQGGTDNPHLDHEMKPLGLSVQDKAALVAYLKALTGEGPPLARTATHGPARAGPE